MEQKLTRTQKVAKAAEKDRSKQIKRNKQYFKKLYDKEKEYKFPYPEDINTNRFFYLPKALMTYELISKAALSIYPVLCYRSNYKTNDWFQISLQNLSKLSGLNIETVSKALDNLLGIKLEGDDENLITLLERKKVIKKRRTFYMYKVFYIRKSIINNWKEELFPFYTSIIESQIWRRLNFSAKRLYLVMRANSYFDWEDYSLFHGLDAAEYKTKDYIKRDWEYPKLSFAELSRIMGVSYPTIIAAKNELLEKRILMKYSGQFIIWVRTPVKVLEELDKEMKKKAKRLVYLKNKSIDGDVTDEELKEYFELQY